MAKAIALWAGGVHALTERAAREDGVVFARYQDKTPYGYRWGPWKRTGERVDPKAPPSTLSAGFSTLYPCARRDAKGNIRVRLPD